MRNAGKFDHGAELGAVLRAHDHVAWVGHGVTDFLRLASLGLATAAPDERLVIAAHLDQLPWDPAAVFGAELATGRVQLVDVTGPYAAMSPVPRPEQLDGFDGLVDQALADGYANLRVVADNTSMAAASDEAFETWLAWEQYVDVWQTRREVTGICWFDGSRVPAERLARIARLHPLLHGVELPGFRVFHDGVGGGELVVEGDVEAFDAAEFEAVLTREAAGRGGELTLDLAHAGYVHHTALGQLQHYPGDGPVRLRNVPTIVLRTMAAMPRLDRLQAV